jgi:flagella basal body P-ring formation protein FlgA
MTRATAPTATTAFARPVRLPLATLLAAAALAGVPWTAARADSVTMKSSVRLGHDVRHVRLVHVADLEGPLALQHAELVVAARDDVTGVVELTVADVRRALDEAGVHWGQVHLTGRRTIVRPAPDPLAAAPVAMAATTLAAAAPRVDRADRPEAEEVAASELVGLLTLRGAVARHVVETLRRTPADVLLLFAAQDEAALDGPLGDSRLELEPLSSLAGERCALAVRVWRDGAIAARHQLALRVLVRATGLAAVEDLPRGHVLAAGDLEAATQWLSPQAADAFPAIDAAVGQALARRVGRGDPVRCADLKRSVVVRRGDQVTARCLVGGLVLTLAAEVREDGATGDVVECRKLGERDVFLATVAGPGEVVVDLTR